MTDGKKENEKRAQIRFQLQIMKALGWYIKGHKDIKQNEIAKKMRVDSAAISRVVIAPKGAERINEDNYQQSGKRLVEICRAEEICRCMDTTLPNVLYYYQFKKLLDNPTELDKLEKMTNELTGQSDCQNTEIQVAEFPVDSARLCLDTSNDELLKTGNIISNVDHTDFQSWFGKYYCYFSSTSSEEAGEKRRSSFDRVSDDPEILELLSCTPNDYIFCGILNILGRINAVDELCHVEFKFLANPDTRFIKRYSGVLTLSANTKAAFCELTSSEQGEKTYFIFERQDLGKEQPSVRCCMAMVLTYSSKVHRRRPCCERMIISSGIIKEGTEEYEVMKAYLRMNDSTIRITQWGYDELLKEINQSEDMDFQIIAEHFPNLQSLAGMNVIIEECAFIPESIVYTLHFLSDSQKRKFERLLRDHSIAPWYCKTKDAKADVLFKLLNSPHDI